MILDEKQVGLHRAQSEPGDVLVIQLRGRVLPGEMRELARLTDAHLFAHGGGFILCDVAAMDGMSPESRHELRDRPKKLPPHFVGYVGAPVAVRVVIDLIIRATSLLTRARIGHRFFDTRAAARAWFAEIRARREPESLGRMP